jgi:hypothetical protein
MDDYAIDPEQQDAHDQEALARYIEAGQDTDA